MAKRAACRHGLDSGIEVIEMEAERPLESVKGSHMAVDLAVEARERGIKYFLISYVDLFGTLRAKLAPAAAIGDMAKDGAGFAGFASWLDMTPADPDVLAIPDPASLIQLPWKPEVGWLAADPWMNGKLVEQAPRNILKRMVAKAAEPGLHAQDRRRMRVLSPHPRRLGDQRRRRYRSQALLRPDRADAPLRRDQRDLRRHARARLGALPERPRGCQRPVRDELAVRRRARHRRPDGLLQIYGEGDRREARAPRHLHAEAVRQPHRQRLPRARIAVAGRQEHLRRRQGRARPVARRL